MLGALCAEQHGSGGGTLEAAVKRRLLLLELSLGAAPTDFTFTNKRRHRGGRERESEEEGVKGESLEVSGVEWKSVKRKKRLQHLPSSPSFSCRLRSVSCVGSEEEEE